MAIRFHQWQTGDSLDALAKSVGTDALKLIALNKLASDPKPGEVLMVPVYPPGQMPAKYAAKTSGATAPRQAVPPGPQGIRDFELQGEAQRQRNEQIEDETYKQIDLEGVTVEPFRARTRGPFQDLHKMFPRKR